MGEDANKSKVEEPRVMPLLVRMVIAFVWCWASGFVSSLVMADPGQVTLKELPTFFFAGLFGPDGSPSIGLVLGLGLLAYCVYIALLWVAVTSRKASVRYGALTVITLASFIAWQGLRNSI